MNITKTIVDRFPYVNLPFEVPESWVWCRLGEIAFLKAGCFVKSEDIKMNIKTNYFRVLEEMVFEDMLKHLHTKDYIH